MAATAISWDSAAARALSVHSVQVSWKSVSWREMILCLMLTLLGAWFIQCRPQRWSFVSCSAKLFRGEIMTEHFCSVGLQANTVITKHMPRLKAGATQTFAQAEAIAVPHLSRSDVSSFRNSRPSTAYPIPAIKTMTNNHLIDVIQIPCLRPAVARAPA